MAKISWVTERRKLSDLKPWPRNPRQLTGKQAERLSESFDEFGQVETLAIGPDGEIYNGHQRLNVLMAEHGADYEVDVRVASRELTEKEREKLTIYLHKGAAGEWDFDILANEFELDDLLDWGFDKNELDLDLWMGDQPEDPGTQIDKAEELREKWGVETGQLWQLGEHRLICGDCTDKSVVDRVMQGEKVDMVFTDPPYGMNLDVQMSNREARKDQWVHKPKNYEPVIGDDKDFDPTFLFELFGYVNEMFLFGADYYAERLSHKNDGSWIVWDKRCGGLEDVGWKTSEFELCWSKGRHQRKIARFRWMGVHGMETQDTQRRVHPTQKPIELFEWFINLWSKNGQIIIDPFLGSGTTLIACERLGRKCRAVEISPAYCAVAIQRWVDMTGGEPVILDDSG